MTTAVGTALLDRVATAPISWGVCEVPGWGYQLPVDRVLAEMSAAGFTRTELGAWGFLPTDPAELRSKLDSHGLSLLGGFVPLVLHDAERASQARAEARRWAELIAGAGGQFFVTCAVSRADCWRDAPLDDSQWARLCESLAEIDALVAAYGLKQAYHSHFDSVVETDAELARILDGCDVSLVLDTAHLALGGTDVLKLLDRYAHRVGLVHIKDLDPALAARLGGRANRRADAPHTGEAVARAARERSEQERETPRPDTRDSHLSADALGAGRLTLMQAVQRGLFPPLGRGGVPIAEIVARLEESGHQLWYVLEQDAAIAEGDLSAVARLRRNADQSLDFLRGLVPAHAGSGAMHNNHRFPEG